MIHLVSVLICRLIERPVQKYIESDRKSGSPDQGGWSAGVIGRLHEGPERAIHQRGSMTEQFVSAEDRPASFAVFCSAQENGKRQQDSGRYSKNEAA